MPRAGTDYKYKVKFVAHQSLTKGDLTRFSIADKLKGTQNQFQNYSFTVWDKIDIKDGDSVKILTIDSVEANYKNNKVYVNLAGTVVVIPTEEREPEPQEPESYAEPPEGYAEPTTDDQGEWQLPFNI